MKKISKLFLIPLFGFVFASLSGCSNSKKVKLTYGEVTYQEVHDINYARLNRMIDNKESFMLVVDPLGCGCYQRFINASKDYIKNNHLVLYRILLSDFNGNSTHGIKIVEGYTSFSLFNKGEIQQSIVSNSEEDIMSKKEEFEKYISKYIEKPNIYLVKPDDLDVMYHSENKSLIYYAQNGCGDCNYLFKNFLIDYMRDSDKIMYCCDCDDIGVREFNANHQLINPEAWTNFKDKYGLSNVNNPVYGYATGFVPSFFVVSGTSESTTFHDGAVAYNDKVEDLVITRSYYSQDRLPNLKYNGNLPAIQGKTVTADEVEYGSWSHEAGREAYTTRIKAFLDMYLPQVTYTF